MRRGVLGMSVECGAKWLGWLAWAACSSACGGNAATTTLSVHAPEVTVSSPPSAAELRPAPSSPALAPDELVVGSERGLEIFAADGSLKRTVSAGPALHPRWLDANSVLVIVPKDDHTLSAGARIERIAIADGRRSLLAVLPPFSCRAKASAPAAETDPDMLSSVNLQDPSDFSLDQGKRVACLRLMDRNINMASVLLDVHINLARPKVERWLGVGEEDCTPPADVKIGEAPSSCAASPEQGHASSNSFAFDITDEGDVLETTPQGAKTALRIPGYEGESLSPSGRWRVAGGDPAEGDYFYRRLILLDRKTGLVYPLIHPEGAWPAPLSSLGKSHRVRTPIEQTLQIVGEADVRWLGDAASELLLIDGTAIRPGLGSAALHGEVAR
jgi:hypothetical protein